MQGGRAN
jgi:hypothetical protein